METHNAASVCAMVKAGVGLSIINPLTALNYASSGVHLRPFSIDVPFIVSLIRLRVYGIYLLNIYTNRQRGCPPV